MVARDPGRFAQGTYPAAGAAMFVAMVPAEVRESWRILLVGDEISRTLNNLKNEGLLDHERERWRTRRPPKDLGPPPTPMGWTQSGHQEALFKEEAEGGNDDVGQGVGRP
jgi:hypothetical protein